MEGYRPECRGFDWRKAMERLRQMDKEQYLAAMQAEVRRILGQVADAVNNAPEGNVICGSEMEVHEAMVHLQRVAFEKAVQMRVDSTESTFSPSAGCGREAAGKQRPGGAQHIDHQRAD